MMFLKQYFKLMSLLLTGIFISPLTFAAPDNMSFAAQAQYVQQIYNQVSNYTAPTTPQTAQAAINYYFSTLLQQAQSLTLSGAYSTNAMTSTKNSTPTKTTAAKPAAAAVTPPPIPSALPTTPTTAPTQSNPIPSGFSD